jgi:hypothetical protein
MGFKLQQLLDCGSSRELMNKDFVEKHGLKTEPMEHPVMLEYMDGRQSERITRMTVQTFVMKGKKIRVEYLVCNIAEEAVLGLNWLQEHNPDINWALEDWTWREHVEPTNWRVAARMVRQAFERNTTPTPVTGTQCSTMRALKARKRIVQGDIQYNEPPQWVRERHAGALGEREPGTLPPKRPGWDYEIEMKPEWKPRQERARNFSPQERRMFEDLAELETHGFRDGGWRWKISSSEQKAQMLWAAKAGGEKRPCVDYRYLNSGMVGDAYPLPKISDMTQDAAGKRWLSSLDIPKAYHELRTSEKTRHLLAFQCGTEQYEPVVMQFGTKTAVQWWQRFLSHVLRRHLKKGVHVYLDNILVYTDTEEEHDRILSDVLTDLEKENLTVKENKCEWKKHEVQFCGFLIGQNGIRMDPVKVQAVTDWEIPHNAKISEGEKRTSVREFLGFTQFCKDKIPDYSEIAAPLTDLTKEKRTFRWGEKEQRSFDKLKHAFTTAPVLMPLNENAPKMTFTDASDRSIGGVVVQLVKGKMEPIAFWGKKLSDTEERYSTHDRELMALRYCFIKHRHWLHGAPGKTIAWTDHSSLRHFLKTTQWKDRQVGWGTDLGEFDIEIRHLPGRSNRAADALSRKHAPGQTKKEREERVIRDEWWSTQCGECRKLEQEWQERREQGLRQGKTKWDLAQETWKETAAKWDHNKH